MWLQVLVYFAVAKLGDKPQDGRTDTNPEGLTAATGKHAGRLHIWSEQLLQAEHRLLHTGGG